MNNITSSVSNLVRWRSVGMTALRANAMRAGVLLVLGLVASNMYAQTLTTLASFNGSNGQGPRDGVTLIGNTLYGTTEMGGAYGDGTVFSVPVGGGSPTVLASFNGSNGLWPLAGVTLIGNTLYGTTNQGGANYDGTVFSLPLSGGSPTVLASFNGSNGEDPWAGVTLSGNTLYGATFEGGAYNDGVVFSLPLSGGSPTVLASFNGSSGINPDGVLTLSGNTLYGTTELDTVFSVPRSGGSPTVLASFNGSNGSYPLAGVTLIGKTLFGTTEMGGAKGDGVVFSVPVSGGSPTVLASFNGSNGEWPYANLTLSGSTLYGTTNGGGANNDGTVFALTVPSITPPAIGLTGAYGATIISGGTGTLGVTVSNSPSATYNLNYTLSIAVQSGIATLGAITSGTGSLAPSASQSCTVPATSTTLGVTTISFTGSDPNASNSPQTTTATLTVLDHAAAAFGGGGTTLNLNFGTLQLGSGTQSRQFQIENLPAAYRAKLDLDLVTPISDPLGLFSTDAMPFADLAPGTTSSLMDLFVNPSQMGNFSGQYQLNLSDEQDLSGWAGQQTLTLNVTADVVPEPATLSLLAAATLGLAGYVWRRRRRASRSAKPAPQDDAPACLSFPSHSSDQANVTRHAA